MLRHFLAGARRQRCDQPDGAAEFQRDKTGGKMSLDSGRRFGALRYAWHGRLLSDWSQPHSARAMVAILLPMGSMTSLSTALAHALRRFEVPTYDEAMAAESSPP